MNFPIKIGSFPVEKYRTPGNGNKNYDLKIVGKDVKVVNVFVRKGDFNRNEIPTDKDSYVIITLVCLTDNLTLSNPTFVTSRNHPNYLGEGTINTTNNKIDWLSIQTVDGNSFAVINMRFFDLNCGRTILVAPQKDESLRFLQLRSNFLSIDDLDNYVQKLKTDSQAVTFFSMEGNI